MIPDNLKELLRAFNDHGVKYLIVGATPSAFMQSREQPRILTFLFGRTSRTPKLYFAPLLSTVHPSST
jgi:hypothetical protein